MALLISQEKGMAGFREIFPVQFVHFAFFHSSLAHSIHMSKNSQGSFTSTCITEQVQWPTWPGQRQGRGGNLVMGKTSTRSWTCYYIYYYSFIQEISAKRSRRGSPSGQAWKGSSGRDVEKARTAWSVHVYICSLKLNSKWLKYLTSCFREI